MSARFWPSPASRDDDAVWRASGDPADPATMPSALAPQACCCVARAVVLVVMPPTAGRPHETELLLCGHHYRVCRQALAQANARVYELSANSGDEKAWLHDDLCRSAAAAGSIGERP